MSARAFWHSPIGRLVAWVIHKVLRMKPSDDGSIGQ
jgi:hypothetical protein